LGELGLASGSAGGLAWSRLKSKEDEDKSQEGD